LKSLYPWNKAGKSLDYNVHLFKFLIVRMCVAEFPFDFLCMFLWVPAYLWQYYMGRMFAWGWCGMDPFGAELVCGVFCLLTWKIARTLWLSPWMAYQMWGLEKKYELAEPNICAFVC